MASQSAIVRKRELLGPQSKWLAKRTILANSGFNFERLSQRISWVMIEEVIQHHAQATYLCI